MGRLRNELRRTVELHWGPEDHAGGSGLRVPPEMARVFPKVAAGGINLDGACRAWAKAAEEELLEPIGEAAEEEAGEAAEEPVEPSPSETGSELRAETPDLELTQPERAEQAELRN